MFLDSSLSMIVMFLIASMLLAANSLSIEAMMTEQKTVSVSHQYELQLVKLLQLGEWFVRSGESHTEICRVHLLRNIVPNIRIYMGDTKDKKECYESVSVEFKLYETFV